MKKSRLLSVLQTAEWVESEHVTGCCETERTVTCPCCGEGWEEERDGAIPLDRFDLRHRATCDLALAINSLGGAAHTQQE